MARRTGCHGPSWSKLRAPPRASSSPATKVAALAPLLQQLADPRRRIAHTPERQPPGLVGIGVRRKAQRHQAGPQQVGEVATRDGGHVLLGAAHSLCRRAVGFVIVAQASVVREAPCPALPCPCPTARARRRRA